MAGGGYRTPAAQRRVRRYRGIEARPPPGRILHRPSMPYTEAAMSEPLPFYRWRPHPWHGLEPGPDAPQVVNAYIEITPFDTIKYEIDKATGYLRVDRPQRGSAQPPTLYGFIPRTFCGPRVADLSADDVSRADGDPLDICVISERPITRSEIV